MRGRSSLIAMTLLCGFALGVGPALSEGASPSSPPPAPAPSTSQPKATKDKKSKQKKSDVLSSEGYRTAYDLMQGGKYVEGIAAMYALGADDHPDVANYIGFASRKLGRYEDAKYWYEKALAADPKHVRTYQYYGMWHVEQGNTLKAKDFLATIRGICGTECKEFASLQEALNGNLIY